MGSPLTRFASSDSASSAVRKSPSTNAPGVVDEEAAVGVPVPRDPEVGAGREHLVDRELPVLGQQRVGLVVGEVAVRGPVGLDQLQSQPLQQRADHRAGHPVAAVHDDLQRPSRRADRLGVDEAQRGLLELGVDVHLLDRARGSAGGAWPLAAARPRRGPPRSAGGCPGCRCRPTAPAPPRARACSRCTPLGCARRCTSARRRAPREPTR